MRLVYHPDAQQEILEAAMFYETKARGLGRSFIDQVDAAAELLVRAPFRWPIVDGNIRRLMLKRFPFAIYFRVADDAIRILTVKHHRRHPGYGLAR